MRAGSSHKWIDTDGLEFVLGRSLGNEPAGPLVAKPRSCPISARHLEGFQPPVELENLLARLKVNLNRISVKN